MTWLNPLQRSHFPASWTALVSPTQFIPHNRRTYLYFGWTYLLFSVITACFRCQRFCGPAEYGMLWPTVTCPIEESDRLGSWPAVSDSSSAQAPPYVRCMFATTTIPQQMIKNHHLRYWSRVYWPMFQVPSKPFFCRWMFAGKQVQCLADFGALRGVRNRTGARACSEPTDVRETSNVCRCLSAWSAVLISVGFCWVSGKRNDTPNRTLLTRYEASWY